MSKPNVILILIDDMGWKDVACCGSEFYETPNIDKLCGDGMRFTNAYASCPVCSPTRASIMTGRYPARVGVTNFIGGQTSGKLNEALYTRYLPLEEHTLATAMRDGGYQTWHVGKWHLGEEPYYPQHQGFDVNVGGCLWGMPGHGYFSPWDIPGLENGEEGEYLTDHLTDKAVDLIKNAGDKPFFLNMWYYSVHIPIQAKQELIEKYEAKAKAMGLDTVKTFDEGEHFPCEHKKDKRVIRRLIQSDPVYAAMIETLDENIGRLLEAVEEIGQTDNTCVVFTSDNGGASTSEGSPTCNLPLAEGKGWMYEGGTREPLIVKYPGVVEPGTICEELSTSTDFYPTFLEMAGLDPIPEQHCDGESLVPLLKGGSMPERPIFWHYPHYGNQGGTPGCSIRCGDWKLIEFFEDGRLELYNLVDDEGEHDNLAATNPDKAAELYAKLVAWREDVEAKLPTPNPDWQPETDR